MTKPLFVAVGLLLALTGVCTAQKTDRLLALHDAVAAACPAIDGVSVGRWNDRSTWRIAYKAGASCEDAAQSALEAFDPEAVENNPVWVTTFVLLSRLTVQEYGSILQAAAAALSSGQPQLSLWLDKARTSSRGVNVNSVETRAAWAALVQQGLLSEERAAVVFAP